MRDVTWNNMGVEVNGADSLDNILSTAGLDYNVVGMPVQYTVDGVTYTDSSRIVTCRANDPSHIYGVVSNNYNICQNKEAFDFLNYVDDSIEFVKAGELNSSGKLVYIIGQLPEVKILDDAFRPNLIFQNSFNGVSAVKANICLLRIVCQNQFASSFKDASNSISVTHSLQMNAKLQEARTILKQTNEYIKTYNWNAEQLACKHISDAQLQAIIKNYITHTEEIDYGKDNVISFMEAYKSDDNSNFTGTAWGVVNAFADFSTHFRKRKETATSVESAFIRNSVSNSALNSLTSNLLAA